MKSLAVALVENNYFKLKENYITGNYYITHYFSCYDEFIGETLNEKTILPISALPSINDVQTIVIAMPLTIVIKKLNQVLFEMGFKADNIVLLFDKPSYYSDENFCELIQNVKYSVAPTGDIVCEVEGRKINIASFNEQSILKEVFGLRCYDVFFPCKKYIVVDIGMNIGISSLFFAGLENVTKIYSFEPFLETYDVAIENLGVNRVLDKVIPLHFGLGATSRTVETSYLSYIKGMMSVVEDNAAYEDGDKYKTTVEIVDVAEAFDEIILSNPEEKYFFKIDCEGAEYEIFERLDETDMLKHIDIIIMEWHKMNNRNVSELELVLQKNNFLYHVIGSRSDSSGMMLAMRSK